MTGHGYSDWQLLHPDPYPLLDDYSWPTGLDSAKVWNAVWQHVGGVTDVGTDGQAHGVKRSGYVPVSQCFIVPKLKPSQSLAWY
jgi:hypothetical protein